MFMSLLRGTAMLQSHSQQTNENSLLFTNFFFHSLNLFTPLIYHFIISCTIYERESTSNE